MEAETSSESSTALSPERVAEMHEAGEVQLIDVRTSGEWDAAHVAGARHVELDEIQGQADTIEKDRPVVFQCRGGSRSEMVASAFRDSGWDAYNMEGGLRAWEERDLPLEPEGGHVAESTGLPGG
jgi:rhodanese-related sulfurtransferase